jgi:hypothetical protein
MRVSSAPLAPKSNICNKPEKSRFVTGHDFSRAEKAEKKAGL